MEHFEFFLRRHKEDKARSRSHVNSLNWIRKAKVSFTQTLSRRRFHWNNTKSTRKEPNSIPVASTSMLREFSHRSKLNAILEKKTRESRKIAPQNDPCTCPSVFQLFILSIHHESAFSHFTQIWLNIF